MKILAKCESCKGRSLIIRKRVYKHKHIGSITSQKLLCGKCARGVRNMIKNEATMDHRPDLEV